MMHLIKIGTFVTQAVLKNGKYRFIHKGKLIELEPWECEVS